MTLARLHAGVTHSREGRAPGADYKTTSLGCQAWTPFFKNELYLHFWILRLEIKIITFHSPRSKKYEF